MLSASDFYRESHAKIYRAALALYGRGEPVDAITLVDELTSAASSRTSAGGPGGRASRQPAAANAAHYARIVREMATLRGLIRAGTEIARLGIERPSETPELVDRAEQVVFELAQSRVTGDFSHIEELLKASFERITALYEEGAEVTGVPAGFREIDHLTSGFQPGGLVILAARPSMGKSGLALCMAANLAVRRDAGRAVHPRDVEVRGDATPDVLGGEGRVPAATGKLAPDDWPRLTAACDRLSKAPIYVDDTGSVTMMEIRSKSRRLKMREPGLGLIIVDYLQLMTRRVGREPRPGGVGDLAVAEGARP